MWCGTYRVYSKMYRESSNIKERLVNVESRLKNNCLSSMYFLYVPEDRWKLFQACFTCKQFAAYQHLTLKVDEKKIIANEPI